MQLKLAKNKYTSQEKFKQYNIIVSVNDINTISFIDFLFNSYFLIINSIIVTHTNVKFLSIFKKYYFIVDYFGVVFRDFYFCLF